MIIVSQDKEKIVNFSNIQEMNIEEWSTMEEGEVIWFYVINVEKNKDYQTEIGRYSTKRRAKEVLQEILNKYKEYAQIESPRDGITNVAILPKVYEMPVE